MCVRVEKEGAKERYGCVGKGDGNEVASGKAVELRWEKPALG